MARIFISYRREDSGGYAGRLYDRLRQHFGPNNLFMDVDTIALGLDFVEAIETAVGSCDALLAVIGRQWLDITDTTGQRRLDNPEDFVRLEIATALDRNIRVIPVLVGNASMPRSTDLPEALQQLVRRQALEVSDRFHPDVDRLIAALETVLGAAPSPPGLPTEPQIPTPTTSPPDPTPPVVIMETLEPAFTNIIGASIIGSATLYARHLGKW